ncbi:MAG TPA: carbamoyl-phosphate synthase large subunit [Solirubrobacterales bacterium]|jgi:carbamoyl-phosphate synthase large subunit|nr:carbamoyl-phosphate synthase large subunit [Solirubrobacterales bacterium]HMX72051.1 carbamoyl-phosphate synthase large subunit [Solirubrobacterales bacterium]HMY26702.1 carbamoyl-phosphate synthase large subunit [Solirubrobacterales bacterium]HNA23062.1 carbamoyl-phosphate synthase large subunit [Solirubrobacterales bacterium]HNC92163.1 carbamoyl-phosphate synthase large subunit [Solirubrobacterales bacterium]
MPKREDIKRIMVVGSGPVVIGQAAEFDYSGVQACKVLLEEGYEVVLVNSNPATIMTDPEFATRTYVEPLLPGPVAAIIEKERPDALLPTLGGQTALNLAMDLSADGTLEKFGVELIGANRDAIIRGEDREVFRQVMTEAGIRIPWSITVESVEQALKELDEGDASLPAIIRPAFTMGGQGGGIAETRDELIEVVSKGIAASPIGQVLVEESVIGWGEFELEVMRDRNDNVVIICSIENVDPMGVHTGDSITVAPAQSLTDPVYQSLRDIAIAVIREVGVETGGSNVQFAVNPADGEIVVIEMNPRVSRSSALASKATGFPIAKMAAKLAVGYALEEIPNDITRATPASFEPTIDYVVTKIPRFAFEKFPGADEKLSTYMQSVGEVMSIGRTFRESFAKALASRELDSRPEVPESDNGLLNAIATPTPGRIDLVLAAFERGLTVEQVHEQAKIDPWFLRELELLATDGDGTGGLERIYNSVDTCAAEFEAATPYYYSSHEPEGSPSEIRRGEKESVVILGAGPNRIGQGIEFDYCCVHAAMTARECGRDAVMVNCNPETVSTDYDTSDRLYFEPLTLEHVLAVCEKEQPEGVIVMFGGQTPLKLAEGLKEAGINLLGTPVEAIDAAEDRGKFGALIDRLGIKPPPYGTALSAAEAEEIAAGIGYPLLVRPSFVLGGRAMEICYSTGDLKAYLDRHVKASPEHPLLLDRFLENAIEVDVDALCDGEEVFVAGIMQHVEEAGVHSGDSACVLPPMSIGQEMIDEIKQATTAIALELGVIGLINIQYALAGGELYVIEANPRASRTVPFVSKAIGIPLAKVATRIMLGQKLADQDLPEFTGDHVSVKEAVLPFSRFQGADSVLGPEMKSTGEVIGIGPDFPTAFGKAQAAAGVSLPESGAVFISVTDTDKAAATQLAAQLHDLGFEILATTGTAQAISRMGTPVRAINKIAEGSPHVVDMIEEQHCDLVINTPTGSGARADGYEIRSAAIRHGIPSVTTLTGASAAVRAMAARANGSGEVKSLQELHAR